MKRLIDKRNRKKRRKMSVRRKIVGTADCPRISIFKSNRHIYAQVINDSEGRTILAISSRGGDTKGLRPTIEDGAKLGEALGSEMKERKIEQAVFDRNGHLYHGVIKAVADGARKAGIRF